jgi:hypothetical protein
MGLAVTRASARPAFGTLKVGDGKKVIGIRAIWTPSVYLWRNAHDHISKTKGKMPPAGTRHTVTLLGRQNFYLRAKTLMALSALFFSGRGAGYGAKAMLETAPHALSVDGF